MKFWTLSLMLLVILVLTGCGAYMAPVIPPGGILFTDTKAPIDTNMESTKLGSKSGESSSFGVLCLFAFGDCSVNTAARNGQIETVTHVDYDYTNILGLYQNFKTIAYGD